jgi:hypothetical protein
MPKIVVCEKLEDFKNIASDSIVIIPRSNLISLFTAEKIERLKKVLDALKKQSSKAERYRFEIPISDIEVHEITKELRKINEHIKIFNEKIIPMDLIEGLLKSNIIPVLIV